MTLFWVNTENSILLDFHSTFSHDLYHLLLWKGQTLLQVRSSLVFSLTYLIQWCLCLLKIFLKALNPAEFHVCDCMSRVVHVGTLPAAKHCKGWASGAVAGIFNTHTPVLHHHKPAAPQPSTNTSCPAESWGQLQAALNQQPGIARNRFSSLPSPQHSKGHKTKQTRWVCSLSSRSAGLPRIWEAPTSY